MKDFSGWLENFSEDMQKDSAKFKEMGKEKYIEYLKEVRNYITLTTDEYFQLPYFDIYKPLFINGKYRALYDINELKNDSDIVMYFIVTQEGEDINISSSICWIKKEK